MTTPTAGMVMLMMMTMLVTMVVMIMDLIIICSCIAVDAEADDIRSMLSKFARLFSPLMYLLYL